MTGEETIVSVIGILTLALVIMLVYSIVSMRKSKQYRKQVMDFYVAAKTRVLAKEDGLDLAAEEITFKSWAKKERSREREHDLDDTIEEELKERVSESVVKKK